MSDDIFDRFNCAIVYKKGEKEKKLDKIFDKLFVLVNVVIIEINREINQTEREQYNYAVCKNCNNIQNKKKKKRKKRKKIKASNDIIIGEIYTNVNAKKKYIVRKNVFLNAILWHLCTIRL